MKKKKSFILYGKLMQLSHGIIVLNEMLEIERKIIVHDEEVKDVVKRRNVAKKANQIVAQAWLAFTRHAVPEIFKRHFVSCEKRVQTERLVHTVVVHEVVQYIIIAMIHQH
uniref:Uncharacterized protein n=1 Tax=Cacopsylla melanoneura TaxID=428564 RepID=A0A8D8QMF1_9HEMI